MNIKKEELKPYLNGNADLIPLHHWNKIVKRKGKQVELGKTPIQKGWTTGERCMETTKKRIKQGHNVGVRLSDEDLIIDADPRNYKDGVDSLELLQEFLDVDLWEVAPTVVTGSGGYHFYFKKPKDWKTVGALPEYPGIDFKSQGGQVVSAGSKHPNGTYYLWDDMCDVPYNQRPDVPGRLLKKLKRLPPKNQPDEGVLNNDQLEQLLSQIPIEDFGEGSHDKWFPLMCACHHATGGAGVEVFTRWSTSASGFESSAHEITVRWESLGGKDVNYTVSTLYKNVKAYGGSIDLVSAQSDFHDFADEEGPSDKVTEATVEGEGPELLVDLGDVIDSGASRDIPEHHKGIALKLAGELRDNSSDEEIVRAIRSAINAGTMEKAKALETIKKNTGLTKGTLNELIKEVKERIITDLGRVLAEKTLEVKFRRGKGLVFNNTGEFWAYKKNHWIPVTKEWVGKNVHKVFDEMRKQLQIDVKENSIVTEALSILSRITATMGDALRMKEKPYPVINCLNGELWIKDTGEVELKPHRPSSCLTRVLAVEYQPGADCPIFKNALKQTFKNFEDGDDIIRHLQEFMGYVLHPDKQPAHWWLFKGPGGDGKSTIMRILSALLGDSVIAESIDRFNGKDNHATADLVGKLLLYDDDLDSGTRLPDGILKKLSETGELTANPKLVKPYRFTKVCTTVMCSNGFPKTKDISRGFRRRGMVIPFNNPFHEGEAILDLVEQVTSKELCGVLNFAMEGLKRMRARSNFQEPTSCINAKDEWLNESNVVASYIKESIERTNKKKDSVSLTDAYTDFKTWCDVHGINRRLTNQQFRQSMVDMDIHYGAISNRKTFFGIKLVREDEDGLDDFDTLEDEEL